MSDNIISVRHTTMLGVQNVPENYYYAKSERNITGE